MSTEHQPYINRNPGDLLTAEDWNDIQRRTREDIEEQIKKAIGDIKNVPNADNASHLEDKSGDEWANDILEKAKQAIPARTGYMRIFRPLKDQQHSIVKHNLGGYPLADVYQLGDFDVVCSEDSEKSMMKVFFFLYHSSEKKLRLQGSDAPPAEIEKQGEPVYRVRFHEMLALYNVEYTERSTLDDLETEFWQAFFAEPNVEFDDDEYCHSPWFDKCCGERRTVAELKDRGDWDDLWFKVLPYKSVNLYAEGTPRPQNVWVTHLDFNSLALYYKADAPSFPIPVPLPSGFIVDEEKREEEKMKPPRGDNGGDRIPDVMHVMVLLKV